MSKTSWKLALCAGGSLSMLAGVAQADHLLLVDLSVPNQVTISATNGVSLVNASGSDTTGVYFENFYGGAGSSLSAPLVAGDITNAENPADNSPALFRGGGGTDPGLNMWSWSTDITVTFTAGSLAFTGSGTWTLDPNEYADMLNAPAGGNLYFPADTVDDLSSAQVLGTYAVIIPTPGAAGLLGLAGLAAVRRRR